MWFNPSRVACQGGRFFPGFHPGLALFSPPGWGVIQFPGLHPGLLLFSPPGWGMIQFPGLHPGLALFSPLGWGGKQFPGFHPGLLLFSPLGWGGRNSLWQLLLIFFWHYFPQTIILKSPEGATMIAPGETRGLMPTNSCQP